MWYYNEVFVFMAIILANLALYLIIRFLIDFVFFTIRIFDEVYLTGQTKGKHDCKEGK